MKNEITHERRRHERYRVKNEHMAYVAVRPSFSQIGEVRDISRGGLCFEYLLLDDMEPLCDIGSSVSIDLFIREKGFYLSSVNCRPAYDIDCRNEHASAEAGFLERRKCGLAFDRLTENQEKQIDVFMKLYTEGTA